MKKFAMILALALAFGAAPAWAQAGTAAQPAEPKKEEPKKEEPKKDAAAADTLKHYRTKGNTWTTKISSKYGSYENVSFSKTEVTEVKDDKATVTVTNMDKDEKVVGEATTQEIPLKVEAPKDTPKETPKDAPKTTTSDEKIKVGAGEIDCVKTVTEDTANKTTTTVWMHKAFPGVVVKMESKSEAGSMTMELVKFEAK